MRFLLSSLLASSVIAASTFAEPITYDVGTIGLTETGSGMPEYVVRGTITTNGTLGPLDASDFVSWSLTVDGPVPYYFHPGNLGAAIDPSDVRASTDLLTTSGQFGWLFVSAESDPTPSCSFCVKRVGWKSWVFGGVGYQNYRVGHAPLFTASAEFDSSPFFIIGRRIPEPLSAATTLIGAAIFSGLVRVKRFSRVARTVGRS